MAQSFPMNGGDATCSYADNSTIQRRGASAVMDAIKETIIHNLDVEKSSSCPCFGSGPGPGPGPGSGSGFTTFVIADIGCSTGPNTFHAVRTLIGAVQHKYNEANLEFQVLFNDQIGNDFNTLFASIPHPRSYVAAGVPGSMYGRIVPSSSVHVAYSAFEVHWMSKVPEAVGARDSPAWNPGRIHYTGASGAVAKAYYDQFEEDMGVFLRARAQEIVHGGMVVILMLGIPHGDVIQGASQLFTFFGSTLMDMVKEGILEQDEVDSFNIPKYFPSVKEMKKVVDENGCFEIVKLETMRYLFGENEEHDIESLIKQYRAIYEGTFSNHFGHEIVDQFFMRLRQRKPEILRILVSPSKTTFHGVLYAVLKRKSL